VEPNAGIAVGNNSHLAGQMAVISCVGVEGGSAETEVTDQDHNGGDPGIQPNFALAKSTDKHDIANDLTDLQFDDPCLAYRIGTFLQISPENPTFSSASIFGTDIALVNCFFLQY
jgi:hypothetical protein